MKTLNYFLSVLLAKKNVIVNLFQELASSRRFSGLAIAKISPCQTIFLVPHYSHKSLTSTLCEAMRIIPR